MDETLLVTDNQLSTICEALFVSTQPQLPSPAQVIITKFTSKYSSNPTDASVVEGPQQNPILPQNFKKIFQQREIYLNQEWCLHPLSQLFVKKKPQTKKWCFCWKNRVSILHQKYMVTPFSIKR